MLKRLGLCVAVSNGSLVGGIPTPLKNMKVDWDDYSRYMGNKKCSKPSTRNGSSISKEIDGTAAILTRSHKGLNFKMFALKGKSQGFTL